MKNVKRKERVAKKNFMDGIFSTKTIQSVECLAIFILILSNHGHHRSRPGGMALQMNCYVEVKCIVPAAARISLCIRLIPEKTTGPYCL